VPNSTTIYNYFNDIIGQGSAKYCDLSVVSRLAEANDLQGTE